MSEYMNKCMECGKNIGKLNSYYHEIYGKRWLFCSKCYNKIKNQESILSKKMREEQTKKEKYQ